MEVVYSKHAKDQLSERKVEKVWVEETIAYPHELFISGKKYDARRKLNGKTLRVIYLKESYIKIITMYWI